MKVVAFNGSARKDGNTAILIRKVFAELEKEGIETELVQFGGEVIRGCTACYKCFKNKDQRCAVAPRTGDIVNDCIAKMVAADGIILASPTYFADITAEIKALIDRAGFVARANANLYRRKVGAGSGRGAPRRRHPRLRLHQPLLPHQPDDHPRLLLLEHRHRQEGRGGAGRGRDENHGGPGRKHGLAAEEGVEELTGTLDEPLFIICHGS